MYVIILSNFMKNDVALFSLLLLPLVISLATLFPVFQLALFGDDWLAFSRYQQVLGPTSTYNYNHLTYFLTLYGPQDILMGTMQKIVGFTPQYYHLLSYVFRLTAAFSIFPLSYLLTKSKIASIFAVIFVSVTPIGLDTTNWVFNMPSYLSIASLSLALYFFIKSHTQINLILPGYILFGLAVIIAPIRMSAALPIILVLEIYYYLSNPATSFKSLFFRSSLSIIIMYLITKTGSFGPPGVIMENISSGNAIFTKSFAEGRFDLIFYQIVTLGGMLIPDFLLNNVPPINHKIQFFTWQIFLFTAFILIIYILNQTFKKSFGKLITSIVLSCILWNLCVYIIRFNNLDYFSESKQFILLTIGGYMSIFSVFLFIKNLLEKNISQSILLSVMLMLLTFFVAWGRSPTTIYETTHRYLIVSSLGMALFLATIISLTRNTRRVFVLSLITIILFMHILSTRIYLNNLINNHGNTLSHQIWSQIPYYPELQNNNGPYIFYFTKDDQSSAILHDVITFGLPPHMGLIYNRTQWNTVPMDEWREVVSAVTDGAVFKKYGFVTNKVNLDHIYSFHLTNKNQLTDETSNIRLKLAALTNHD